MANLYPAAWAGLEKSCPHPLEIIMFAVRRVCTRFWLHLSMAISNKTKQWIQNGVGGLFLLVIVVAFIHRIRETNAKQEVLQERGIFTVGRVVSTWITTSRSVPNMLLYEFKTIDDQIHHHARAPFVAKRGSQHLVVYDPQNPQVSMLILNVDLPDRVLGEDLTQEFREKGVKVPSRTYPYLDKDREP